MIATGGTIASLRGEGAEGPSAVLSLKELLRRARNEASPPVGCVVDLARVNSWNVDPPLMWEIASTVARLAAQDDVAGVVVTHGTDTLEESAFLCDVLVNSHKPVVFTAAMRAADELSPDGPGNLRAALGAAVSPALTGLGTVVCLDGRLQAARWVRKWHTYSTAAFSGGSPIANVDPDGTVRRTGGELPRWTVPGGASGTCPRSDDVPVVQAYSGMSARAAQAMVEATSPRGVVVEGFGLGHVPQVLRDAIEGWVADGVVVAVSTRVSSGGTRQVYAGPGGGTDLAHLGVVGAGDLSAGKARLLLLACLADRDRETGQRLFQDAVSTLSQGAEGWTHDLIS